MSHGRAPAAESDAVRRKRLRYRSWHRGMKEMDLILGRFADQVLATMTVAELDNYEVLLSEQDPDLYDWICRRKAMPEGHTGALIERIIEFHTAKKTA